ncbi:MAG: GNAT family N-acetyltransferase [archaeon]
MEELTEEETANWETEDWNLWYQNQSDLEDSSDCDYFIQEGAEEHIPEVLKLVKYVDRQIDVNLATLGWVYNFFIAQQDDKIIGVQFYDIPDDNKRIYGILTIVHPAYRQRGIGKALIEALDRFDKPIFWKRECKALRNITSER